MLQFLLDNDHLTLLGPRIKPPRPWLLGVQNMTTVLPPQSGSSSAQLEAVFLELVARWKDERGPTSSTTELAMCPSYQRIIGLGPAVVPLLLREMEREPDHWFWALRAITGADPVPPASRGKVRDMAQIWIGWGRQQGYRW